MAAIATSRFDEAALLAAWERTLNLARPWREVALLAETEGGDPARIARLPIGERDRRLLALRQRVFGSTLACEGTCPACSARLEWTLDASRFETIAGDEGESEFECDGVVLRLRAPDSTDVAACDGGAGDPEEIVLSRCVNATDASSARLALTTGSSRERLAERLSELDPAAELLLVLECAACGHSWQALFDPAAFLLAELDAWAVRVMGEVDRLARVYGWREADVLALSPLRRRRYLELAQQ
jgi:hypothetical protein